MSSLNHFSNMYLKHLQRFGNVAQTFQQMFCKLFIPPLKNVMNMCSVCWPGGKHLQNVLKALGKLYH